MSPRFWWDFLAFFYMLSSKLEYMVHKRGLGPYAGSEWDQIESTYEIKEEDIGDSDHPSVFSECKDDQQIPYDRQQENQGIKGDDHSLPWESTTATLLWHCGVPFQHLAQRLRGVPIRIEILHPKFGRESKLKGRRPNRSLTCRSHSVVKGNRVSI